MLAALLLSLSLAAPGDAIYLMRPGEMVAGKFVQAPPIILDYPQTQDFKSALASSFPGVKPASFDRYVCWANPPQIKNPMAVDLQELATSLPWPCYALDNDPVESDDEVFDLELGAGQCLGLNETDCTFQPSCLWNVIDAKKGEGLCQPMCEVRDRPNDGTSYSQCACSNMSPDARILNGAFMQSAYGHPLNLIYESRCDRIPGDKISCVHIWVKIASIPIWRTDRKLGKTVGKPLGKVAPAN